MLWSLSYMLEQHILLHVHFKDDHELIVIDEMDVHDHFDLVLSSGQQVTVECYLNVKL